MRDLLRFDGTRQEVERTSDNIWLAYIRCLREINPGVSIVLFTQMELVTPIGFHLERVRR